MQKDPRPGIEPRTFFLQGNSATNCATDCTTVQPTKETNGLKYITEQQGEPMTNVTRQSGENTEQVWAWGEGRQNERLDQDAMVRFPLKEVQSTRTQRPTSGSSYPYVEIMIGDLLNQRITQLQLEQGLELCRVIAMHMENMLSFREKRLTLPPSEITLL
ncbi:hypothetical protein CHARACLAT_032805 [Characodon lateralis]|uniref:Uncharacterized protein n=1 Tax=Characodon lateralis TaxID=208331 RepID=A0ABU7ESJ3_9TELE|nr:hypothetical protein [Characodon lateralis]